MSPSVLPAGQASLPTKYVSAVPAARRSAILSVAGRVAGPEAEESFDLRGEAGPDDDVYILFFLVDVDENAAERVGIPVEGPKARKFGLEAKPDRGVSRVGVDVSKLAGVLLPVV